MTGPVSPPPIAHRLLGVRGRLLLVVAAAILPTLGVGLTTWRAARSVLREKTSGQLGNRVDSVRQRIDAWVGERREDVEIFSTSFIVAEALAGPAVDREAAARIEEYLRQVQDRFPLYTTLAVADASGRLVACAGARQEQPLAAPRSGTAVALENGPAGPRLRLSRTVVAPDERAVGMLTAVGELDGLWRRLTPDLEAELGELHLVSRVAAVTLSREGAVLVDRGVLGETRLERCTASGVDLAEYRNRDGVETLGACRRLEDLDLVVLVELDARAALASVEALTNPSLVILLLGMVAVFLLGWALVGSVVRPIEALIQAARAVSGGDYSHRIPVTSRDELGYLSAVFNDMTEALRASHGELEQLTRTDQLTGVANRRQLDAALTSELRRARQSDETLSVVMVDLDHFKSFNDRFGHQEGDAMLRAVGKLLSDLLRPTDTVARYGGEEFTLLLPATPKDEALRISERLRRRMAELASADTGRPVTASFGVASFPEDAAEEGALLSAADSALYAAKAAGRDRVQAARTTEAPS
jgi:diguanylate cyclase (GGDEF)-like protein